MNSFPPYKTDTTCYHITICINPLVVWHKIRTCNITYPDNEVVNYEYDFGGQLFKMYNVQLTMYNYLDSITYDHFGAKISQKYGNGIKTKNTTFAK
ncbi:MAG: hypothetical protein K6F29_00020 [Bacteroidales bacterium]|nr:hypothetical protein [Bacteroidales bacterium]MCR5553900.1 hypothetical protein [Bacteroidales bacterium]